jgi:hypothetical protein
MDVLFNQLVIDAGLAISCISVGEILCVLSDFESSGELAVVKGCHGDILSSCLGWVEGVMHSWGIGLFFEHFFCSEVGMVGCSGFDLLWGIVVALE